jgi:LysM repeat protein
VDIRPGLILKIPARRIVAQEPPEVAAIRARTPADQDRGLVEAIDVSNAPKARLVRPAGDVAEDSRAVEKTATPAASAATAASGKTHTVKPGENIWRIANKYKVGQDALMQANGITDARKLRAGMNLVIPASH